MVIVITKRLEGFWGTPEELAGMSDDDVIEMVREDIMALLDGADWDVARSRRETPKDD